MGLELQLDATLLAQGSSAAAAAILKLLCDRTKSSAMAEKNEETFASTDKGVWGQDSILSQQFCPAAVLSH